MSENSSGPTELTSQYAAQVTSDLERNIKEQERVSGELAALQQQLAALQHDHTVLVNMQQALGVPATPTTTTEPEPEQATVPAPRKKAAAGTSTKKRAKKTAAARGGKPARKKAAEDTAAASKPASLTLVELIRRHLAEQSEPRSTAEITAALNQNHPDRDTKATVVRTTLESLVAKGQVQRTKQGSSVYYVTADAPESTPDPQSEAQPDSGE